MPINVVVGGGGEIVHRWRVGIFDHFSRVSLQMPSDLIKIDGCKIDNHAKLGEK